MERDNRVVIQELRKLHEPAEESHNCVTCGQPYACDVAWLAGELLTALDRLAQGAPVESE